MKLLIFVCAVTNLVKIKGDVQSDGFRKCCPKNHVLLRLTDNNSTFTGGNYECIDSNTSETDHNVSSSALIVSDDMALKIGFPEDCVEFSMISVNDNIELKTSNNVCYDRLVVKTINGSLKKNVPRTVALACNETEDMSMSDIRIKHIRKCCPRGQVYDSEYHLCRHDERAVDEEGLLKRLNVRTPYVYESETGLRCKLNEFSMELKESVFTWNVRGNILNVMGRKQEKGGQLLKGEWCIDDDYADSGLVARVCTSDCITFGAFCIRKCCPIGEHYKPKRCGSQISTCVPNIDDGVLFNISTYLDPLKKEDNNFADVLGFRSDLRCPAGKYSLNRSSDRDRHRLTRKGVLELRNLVAQNYCIEAFDKRHCGENVDITAVTCFVVAPITKNFSLSFVMNCLSSVCLALTLVVYCALPELRNLHGRTLICHVSMMLLACSCLARVQYGIVLDNRVCTILAYGIYFGFVAAFAWLNVMCVDIWWTFGSVRTVQRLHKSGAECRRFLWYSLYAWSVAFLLTLTMFLLDKYPIANFLDANMGNEVCWFGSVQNTETDWPHYIFFVIPMGLVTCTNFVLWILTARHCARVKSEVHRMQAGSIGDRAKKRFRVDRAKYTLTGKLWVVMGANWVAELLSTLASEPKWLWTVIDLINELQGVFIFLILVFKPKLYYLIRKRLGLEKPDAQKNGTSSSARTSSTFLSRTISSDERNHLKTSLPVKQA